MGENQGMIWIILGVLVVAAAVIFLGGSMSSTMISSEAKVEAQSAMTWEACSGLNNKDEYKELDKFVLIGKAGNPIDDAVSASIKEANYDHCEFI